MNEGFADLSQGEKSMLDSFAEQILALQTPSYIEFIKRGGLGTSDAFWVATGELTDENLK